MQDYLLLQTDHETNMLCKTSSWMFTMHDINLTGLKKKKTSLTSTERFPPPPTGGDVTQGRARGATLPLTPSDRGRPLAAPTGQVNHHVYLL